MKTIFLALLSVVILTSCSDNVTAPETKYYSMRIVIDHRFKGQPFSVDNTTAVYINDAGNSLQFTNFKYLMTMELTKSDGSKVALPNRYGFIDLHDGKTSFTIDSIPAGNYKGLSCMIGVDSVSNHADPNKWPAGHPLNTVVNNLHWGWAGGYIFLAMDGNYLPQGGGNTGFSFHIGGDEYKMPYTLLNNIGSLSSSSALELQFDVDKLFGQPNVYDLARDGMFSHSGNDGGIVRKLVENSSGAISVKSFGIVE